MTESTQPKGGPRTPEGKRRSSLNAMKSGIHAKSPQALEEISKELGISFFEIHANMSRHYMPKDHLEEMLVRRIAKCMWRLELSNIMEQRNIGRRGISDKPGVSYDKILRYERLVDIHLHRTIETLARKRETENNQKPENELPYGHF